MAVRLPHSRSPIPNRGALDWHVLTLATRCFHLPLAHPNAQLPRSNYQEYNSYRSQPAQGMQQGNNWPEAEERRKATENHIVVVFMWLQSPFFS